jgi:hypothetical protein
MSLEKMPVRSRNRHSCFFTQCENVPFFTQSENSTRLVFSTPASVFGGSLVSTVRSDPTLMAGIDDELHRIIASKRHKHLTDQMVMPPRVRRQYLSLSVGLAVCVIITILAMLILISSYLYNDHDYMIVYCFLLVGGVISVILTAAIRKQLRAAWPVLRKRRTLQHHDHPDLFNPWPLSHRERPIHSEAWS